LRRRGVKRGLEFINFSLFTFILAKENAVLIFGSFHQGKEQISKPLTTNPQLDTKHQTLKTKTPNTINHPMESTSFSWR
jgi:hypothetical protein